MAAEIAYTLRMPHPERHRFQVEVALSGLTEEQVTLVMPVWAPGSYLIREFARHVEAFTATSAEGAPLAWRRIDKHRWQVATGGHEQVVLHYEVYARELSVRTSHLDDSHGYFNGTSLFMYVEGALERPVTLQIEPPAGWKISIALPQDASGRYLAAHYDELADSPGEIGTHRLLRFESLERPHEIALWGEGNEDPEQLVEDTRRIVETTAALFDHELPYDRFLFIVHLGDKLRGGLEHRASTTLAANRWSFRPREDYEQFLRLVAHEFLHTWFVKRIRPHNLGPFDYTREVYTPLLWVMEGFTSYYDLLLLLRAGIISVDRYLTLLGKRIATYLQQPGRLVQNLEASSESAWIKLYRQDENSVNSSISYYLKGSLVALILDLNLRTWSEGRRSLDDVLRVLWERYGTPDVGFTPAEFEAVLSEIAGRPIEPILTPLVRDVVPLPLAESLRLAGLTLLEEHRKESPPLWTGLLFKQVGGGLEVKSVLRSGPGEAAGLMAEDRLIAIDGYRLPDRSFLLKRLAERSKGDQVTFHLFRYGRLIERTVTLAARPADRVRLEPLRRPTPLQRTLFRQWLHPHGDTATPRV